MAKQKSESVLSKARGEANTMIVDAKGHGIEIIESAKKDAETQAKDIIDQAKESAKSIEADMNREFSKHAAGIVVDGIEKILKENITPENE
jgi:F0F1-type ATP synthase membrane subunit b/b'